MRNLKKLLLIILSLVLFTACTPSQSDGDDKDTENSGDAPGDSVTMRAEITELGERLLVTVIESEYTFGPHVVHTPDETKFSDENGNAITREDLNVGDIVDIRYGGQVMMSYPPQIVAAEIRLVDSH